MKDEQGNQQTATMARFFSPEKANEVLNAQACQPYKVRASCGHIVVRRMRPATAGVPYTPDVVLDAPNGRACDECEKATR